jgi:uncharacterized protein with PhoU and TrkA domain
VVQTLAKVSNVDKKIAKMVVKEAVMPMGVTPRVMQTLAEEVVHATEDVVQKGCSLQPRTCRAPWRTRH